MVPAGGPSLPGLGRPFNVLQQPQGAAVPQPPEAGGFMPPPALTALAGVLSERSERPSGEAASSSLGPLHGVSGRPSETRWVRQLAMWDLLYGERCAKCRKLRRSRNESIELRRNERGSWSVSNLVLCGLATVCPCCSFTRAREVCSTVGAAISKHLRAAAPRDVWMLTLTIPHAGMAQAVKVAALRAAWSAFTGSRQWKRFRWRWGVRAVVRVFDETFGAHGLHPHWHVALFVEHSAAGFTPLRSLDENGRAAFLADYADELREPWAVAVESAGLQRPDVHGVSLDGAERAAAYFSKWGLADELAMGPLKSRNRFALLDEYRAGDAHAGELFRDFYRATKGLAVVTGLASLREYLSLSDEEVSEHLRTVLERRAPSTPTTPLVVRIAPYFHRAAVRVGWPALESAADSAGDVDAQSAVDELLFSALARLGPERPSSESRVWYESPADTS